MSDVFLAIFIVFLILKLAHVITISWFLVLLPLMIPLLIICIIVGVLFIGMLIAAILD